MKTKILRMMIIIAGWMCITGCDMFCDEYSTPSFSGIEYNDNIVLFQKSSHVDAFDTSKEQFVYRYDFREYGGLNSMVMGRDNFFVTTYSYQGLDGERVLAINIPGGKAKKVHVSKGGLTIGSANNTVYIADAMVSDHTPLLIYNCDTSSYEKKTTTGMFMLYPEPITIGENTYICTIAKDNSPNFYKTSIYNTGTFNKTSVFYACVLFRLNKYCITRNVMYEDGKSIYSQKILAVKSVEPLDYSEIIDFRQVSESNSAVNKSKEYVIFDICEDDSFLYEFRSKFINKYRKSDYSLVATAEYSNTLGGRSRVYYKNGFIWMPCFPDWEMSSKAVYKVNPDDLTYTIINN